MFNDEELTIKSLPILLKVIEDSGFDPRAMAEATTIHVSLAVLYDLIAYIEQKKDTEMEAFKQKVKAVLR